MSFLLAKILFLLIVAALLGAWFARWWLRRHYVDVTAEYARLEGEWHSWRRTFEEKLAQRPTVDLTPLNERFERVESSIRGIEIQKPVAPDLNPVMAAIASIPRPVPKEVDLQPTQARLAALEQAVRGIQIPTPKDVDLGPVLTRLGSLESKLGAIRIPEPTAPVDLGPTQRQLAEVGKAVAGIRIPVPKDVDLAPLQARLVQLEQAVKGIAIPVPKDVDFGAVNERLQALDQAVRSIRLPEIPAPQKIDLNAIEARLDSLADSVRNLRMPTPVDLTPTQQRLEALERAVKDIVIPPITQVDLQPVLRKLAELETRPAPAAAVTTRDSPVVRPGSRNLLSHAGYGKADDLKRMKGVKKVMEKMLHGVGVYYFWQIAEWMPADVRHADAQLTAFHGRIERDDWVTQATGLSRSAGAAAKPADL